MLQCYSSQRYLLLQTHASVYALFRQGVVTAMLRIHDNTDIDKGESEGTLTSVFVTSEKIDCESSWVTGCPKACNLTQCMLEKSLKLEGKKVTGQRMSGNWE